MRIGLKNRSGSGEWCMVCSSAYPNPLIPALNGVSSGSGFQVALLTDIRVGHPGIKMGQAEINSGIRKYYRCMDNEGNAGAFPNN